MKRILILDTETLDLPDNINLSEEELSNIGVKDNNNVPLAYQLSYLFDNGQKRFFADCIGKPILPISIASSEITHVTNKDIEELTLKEDGSYLKLTENKEFKDLVNLVETVNNEEIYLVGHNVKYDIEIMRREGLDLSKCKAIDTLQLARFLDKESEAHRLTYLLYAKEDVLNATRELVQLDQIKNVAKIQPISAHNSLFDVVSTNYLLTHYRDRLLEMNKDLTLDTVYEELHKISTTPFLIEEVPFGGSKGKLIKELNENEILWIYKMDIDEMNFRYSLEERMNDFGGLDAIIKKMSNFDIEKLLSSNPEFFKLEELKVKLNKELDSRSGGVVTLGFGKYKDVNIQEIKHDYLIWLRDNNSGNPNTLKKVETELKRRSEGELSKSIEDEKPKIDAIENSQTLLEDFLMIKEIKMKEKSLIIRKQIIDKIKEIYYDIEDLSNNSEIDKIYNTIINMTKKTSFEDNLKIIKEVFNLNNLDDKYLIDFFFDKRYSLNINNKEVLIPMSYIKTNENINTINNTIEKINKLKATKVETIIFLFDTLNIYEIDKNSINKNTKLEKLIETNVLKALDFQELQNIIDKSNSIKNNSKNEIIEDFINDLDR